MIKYKLISHLAELENIRMDQYMTDDIIDKVIELERILTMYLSRELNKAQEDHNDSKTNS